MLKQETKSNGYQYVKDQQTATITVKYNLGALEQVNMQFFVFSEKLRCNSSSPHFTV